MYPFLGTVASYSAMVAGLRDDSQLYPLGAHVSRAHTSPRRGKDERCNPSPPASRRAPCTVSLELGTEGPRSAFDHHE
jgi:hypothetical protein